MRTEIVLSTLAGLFVASTGTAAIAPYAADANTLHLWHFDESSGSIEDFAGSYDLDNTGGPTGRNATTSGGYAATAYAGLGLAFSPIAAGTGTYHSLQWGTGGGVGSTAKGATVASATGAFTWEALVKTNTISGGEYEIISQDGQARGGMFRLLNGTLNLYNGAGSVSVAVPSAGDHGFVANEWFHAAVSYTGEAGTADNVKFYWTRADSAATEANLIGSQTLAADVLKPDNVLMIGGASRSAYRFELDNVDEVRISDRVRGAGEFMFVVPEPASLGLIVVGAGALMHRRRAAR